MVRFGGLNAEGLGSNTGMNLSSVIPGANSPGFVNSLLVYLLPDRILNWERGVLT